MNSSNSKDNYNPNSDLKAGIVKRIIQVKLTIIFQALVLFLSSGHFDWIWGWIFIGLQLLGILINLTLMLQHSPETIAERAKTGGMKNWDKIVGGLWAVLYFIFMLTVAGLDNRFDWTGQISFTFHITGTTAFVLGSGLFSWSMISNAYFSTVVRIQEDRDHTVCTTGPYQFVRHPGYIAVIIQSFGIPLMLGSLWSLIPGGLAALMMVLRTTLEDQMLKGELNGYQEYTERVQYRLLPGIW